MAEDLAEMRKEARERLRRLIEDQGVKPLTIETLRAMSAVWPADESVDEFLEARERWRREDDNLCSVLARVSAEAVKSGRPIENADAWIAATALVHNIPLVTHNRSHFEGVIGLNIISQG